MAAESNTPITTVDALKTAYPDLVATIQNDAIAGERARIKAIEDGALDGFEAIVSDAKFENPISAEAMALKIIAEQKKAGGAYLENRNADANNSGANGVQGAAGEKGSDKADPYNAAIDKLFAENK